MRRKKRKFGGRDFEIWMFGCELGVGGCFGRLFDLLMFGRVGGVIWGGCKKYINECKMRGERLGNRSFIWG